MSMALDLILAHNRGSYFKNDLYVVDRLHLDQNYRLYGQIDNEHMQERGVKQVCDPKPIPPGFKINILDEEDGWKTETTTPYGDKLTYVLAEELTKLKQDGWTDWNKAVFAMVKALPKDCPIVLWWH